MKIDTMKGHNSKFFWHLVDFKAKLPETSMFRFRSNFENRFLLDKKKKKFRNA